MSNASDTTRHYENYAGVYENFATVTKSSFAILTDRKTPASR